MKLSKDAAGEGFTMSDAQAVDLAARLATTHIAVDTPMEYPDVLLKWASRVHRDRKQVWFRLASTNCDEPHGDLGDGFPRYRHGYLTDLHALMRAHRSIFSAGDILDGDAEAENSCWWVDHYGCAVQARCRPCNHDASHTPCAPVRQFNTFLMRMTRQENRDLAAMRISGVATNVHSTDPGTAMSILSHSFVRSMADLITVDAYPDQHTMTPGIAARDWARALALLREVWRNRGVNVLVLLGEWGYPNAGDVSASTQRAVIGAETSVFARIPYLVGANYWVGPGAPGDGGYTQIFYRNASGWHLRPAAPIVSRFYARMAGDRRWPVRPRRGR